MQLPPIQVESEVPDGAIPTGWVAVHFWLHPETGDQQFSISRSGELNASTAIGGLELAKAFLIAEHIDWEDD